MLTVFPFFCVNLGPLMEVWWKSEALRPFLTASLNRLQTVGLCRDRSNGVGGHRLIPQGTVGQLLSSPYCTQILLVGDRLLSVSLTFPPFDTLLQHATHEAKW